MRGDDLHHRGTENTEIERSGDVGLRGQETELALGQITEQIIGDDPMTSLRCDALHHSVSPLCPR